MYPPSSPSIVLTADPPLEDESLLSLLSLLSLSLASLVSLLSLLSLLSLVSEVVLELASEALESSSSSSPPIQPANAASIISRTNVIPCVCFKFSFMFSRSNTLRYGPPSQMYFLIFFGCPKLIWQT